jgi:hypothetical protein
MTNPTGQAIKQSSARVSSIAARIMRDPNYKPTNAEVRSLAASVLSQDTTKGQSKPKARKVRVLAIIENNDHEDDGA